MTEHSCKICGKFFLADAYRKTKTCSLGCSIESRSRAKRKKVSWVINWEKALIAKLDTPCWESENRGKRSKRYPSISINGRGVLLHRYLFEELFGKIPHGQLVRHKCDNMNCINPEHWVLGTHQDNMNDRTVRNRTAKGQDHYLSKLTEEDVKFILNNPSISSRELSKKFNVLYDSIHNVRIGYTWKHIKKEASV